MSDGIRDSMNGSNAYLFGSHGRLPDAAPEPTGGQAQKARLEQIAERLAKCSSETEDAARGTVEDGADCNALWTAADHIDEARKILERVANPVLGMLDTPHDFTA
jgi:hypothetical protein